MAGHVPSTIELHVGGAHIVPDVCPAAVQEDGDRIGGEPLYCWKTRDLWGADTCPFLHHVARTYRPSSRYQDPMHCVDERHSVEKVVGRVTVMCLRATQTGTVPGAK